MRKLPRLVILSAASALLASVVYTQATTTPPAKPAQDPAAGATLCANNPFCLPEHMRPVYSTSGEPTLAIVPYKEQRK